MIEVRSELEMRQLGERIGHAFIGGEIVELVGDVGAGKTTLVHGIAKGMGIDETVQSPSFTINRVYEAPNDLRLVHYDFYRLSDPGIMRDELQETVADPKTSTVIEWADSVEDVLPVDKLIIAIRATGENERQLDLTANGERSRAIQEKIA